MRNVIGGITCTVALGKSISGGNWSRRLNRRCSFLLLDTVEAPEGGNGKLLEEEKIVEQLSWLLMKHEEFPDDIQGYRRQRRKAL